MNLAMQLPARNAVFRVTKNKQQLIMLIGDDRMLFFITAKLVYTKLVVTSEAESPIDIHKSVNLLSKGST